MVEYRGIEKVDAQALSSHRALTEALWLTLRNQGAKDRMSGRVECFFVARENSSVASLLNGFPRQLNGATKSPQFMTLLAASQSKLCLRLSI